MEKISDNSFLRRALKAYDNPNCISLEEFETDLQKFIYIKKTLTIYDQTGEINERLLLNHIITCFNLFGDEALVFLLFRVVKEHWKYLFPFLLLLNRLPEFIAEYGLIVSDIPLDKNLIEKLRLL